MIFCVLYSLHFSRYEISGVSVKFSNWLIVAEAVIHSWCGLIVRWPTSDFAELCCRRVFGLGTGQPPRIWCHWRRFAFGSPTSTLPVSISTELSPCLSILKMSKSMVPIRFFATWDRKLFCIQWKCEILALCIMEIAAMLVMWICASWLNGIHRLNICKFQ